MKVDGRLGGHGWGIAGVTATTARLEKSGHSGMWSSESRHAPFPAPALVAEHTDRIDLGTSITVAFARALMRFAYTAHDLRRALVDGDVLSVFTVVAGPSAMAAAVVRLLHGRSTLLPQCTRSGSHAWEPVTSELLAVPADR